MENNLKTEINNYRSFYEGYEVALFFDTLARKFKISEYVNENIKDGDYLLDNKGIIKNLDSIFGKTQKEINGNYYGFIFESTYKTLFSKGFEILELLKNLNIQTLSEKIGEQNYKSFYQIFKFLRNFWIHNTDSKFKIQSGNFSGDRTWVIGKEGKKVFPNGVVKFIFKKTQINDFTFNRDLEVSIDFNRLSEGQDVREICCDFEEMKKLLRLFYNFCSLIEEKI